MKHSKLAAIVVAVAFLTLALVSVIPAAGPKDVVYPGKTLGDVVFKHAFHSTEKKLSCKDCHPGIFKMKANGSGMTMEAMNKGEFCAKCHDGTKAFGVLPQENCAKCHAAKCEPTPAPQ